MPSLPKGRARIESSEAKDPSRKTSTNCWLFIVIKFWYSFKMPRGWSWLRGGVVWKVVWPKVWWTLGACRKFQGTRWVHPEYVSANWILQNTKSLVARCFREYLVGACNGPHVSSLATAFFVLLCSAELPQQTPKLLPIAWERPKQTRRPTRNSYQLLAEFLRALCIFANSYFQLIDGMSQSINFRFGDWLFFFGYQWHYLFINNIS